MNIVLVQREVESSVRRIEQGGDILSEDSGIVSERFFAFRKHRREEGGVM